MLHPNIMVEIEANIKKLIELGFIRKSIPIWWQYSLCNEENGKIIFYIDFRDINEAYPKHEFPL